VYTSVGRSQVPTITIILRYICDEHFPSSVFYSWSNSYANSTQHLCINSRKSSFRPCFITGFMWSIIFHNNIAPPYFLFRRIKKIMKNTIWIFNVVFIVDNPRVINNHPFISPSNHFNFSMKSILTSICLAVKQTSALIKMF